MKERKADDINIPPPVAPLPPVDVTQLYERLKLTPAERLRLAAESANNLRAFLASVRLRK